MEYEKTNRGFNIYGTVKDNRGCTVTVQQSSAAEEDYAWLFIKDTEKVYESDPAPHLTVDQAKELIQVLTNFVEDRE